MADPTEARFEAAVNVVRSMPKKGPYQPSYDTMLKFYAYYKQAKEGECYESKPGFWDVIRKAKWEAWHGLGQMSKQEAMESYVSELKTAIENVPDSEKAEELNDAFKSFYKVVYKDQHEKPPAALRVFEEMTPVKLRISEDFKSNGRHSPESENVSNEHIEMHHVYGIHSELGVNDKYHMNGFPHSLDNQNGKDFGHNGLHISNGYNPVVIISTDELKNGKSDDDDTDSGIQNGESEVSPLKSSVDGSAFQLPKTEEVNGVPTCMSTDESEDEEFCDSLEPEYLQELQNGNHTEGNKFNSPESTAFKTDAARNSDASSSPEQTTNSVYSESENSDLEDEVNGSQLLTSTPFAKHVTFAVDDSEAVKSALGNVDTSQVESLVSDESCLETLHVLENGHSERNCDVNEYESFTPFAQGSQKLAGILKPSDVGWVCGGGDSAQQPTEQAQKSRTRPSQERRTKESSSTVSGIGRLSRGYRQRSDSDSDDDHTSGPDYDSAADSEVNNKILEALERLHQDMKHVIRRLGTVEEAVVSRQDSASRFTEPWWKAYVPSQGVMFLILWPFIVNIIIFYFRRRKRKLQHR